MAVAKKPVSSNILAKALAKEKAKMAANRKKKQAESYNEGFKTMVMGGMGAGKSYAASKQVENWTNLKHIMMGDKPPKAPGKMPKLSDLINGTSLGKSSASKPKGKQEIMEVEYENNVDEITGIHPNQTSKKQQFNPEDYRGKYCAHVHLTHYDVEYTGILFVKQCGHWKLMEYNGNKLAGGTSGSFEAECKKGTLKIEVITVLYDADNKTKKPVQESYGDLDIMDIIGETGLEIS